jgi:hypothetical protein
MELANLLWCYSSQSLELLHQMALPGEAHLQGNVCGILNSFVELSQLEWVNRKSF